MGGVPSGLRIVWVGGRVGVGAFVCLFLCAVMERQGKGGVCLGEGGQTPPLWVMLLLLAPGQNAASAHHFNLKADGVDGWSRTRGTGCSREEPARGAAVGAGPAKNWVGLDCHTCDWLLAC